MSQLLQSVDVDQNDPLFQAALAQINASAGGAGGAGGTGGAGSGGSGGDAEGGTEEEKNNRKRKGDGA